MVSEGEKQMSLLLARFTAWRESPAHGTGRGTQAKPSVVRADDRN